MRPIPLAQPYLTQADKQAVLQVLEGSHLSLGAKLYEFESWMAGYVNAKYAVAVNSGTSALHLCIKSLRIKEGDEVITTPFSFIASSNCILYEKATPVFVDIDPATYNIDANKIKEKITAKTKAILPVHVFGLPCDMLRLQAIAQKHHLKIIEDACEAIGATCRTVATGSSGKNGQLKQHKVGALGDCGAFGFYPNKQITTGEGGAVVTNDQAIARNCKSLRNQGRSNNTQWLEHDQLGYNYRIDELSCALGIAQLAQIEQILAKREKVAAWYNARLNSIKELILPPKRPNRRQSWFVYVVRLQDEFNKSDRDEILNRLQKSGIECRCYFPPLHLQPFYVKKFGYKRGDFPNTEHVADRTIALPFFTGMIEEQVDRVCAVFKRILKDHKCAALN